MRDDYTLYVLIVSEAASEDAQAQSSGNASSTTQPSEATIFVSFETEDSGLSAGSIAVIVIVVLLIVVPLILVGLYYLLRRRVRLLQKKTPVWIMPEATHPDFSTNQDLLTRQ